MTVMLLALFANAAPLERDAYVMRVGTDEATVLWKTATNSSGQVRVFPPNSDPAIVVDSSPGLLHEVRVTGLSPDTEYSYEVFSDGVREAAGPSYFFRTAPPVGSREACLLYTSPSPRDATLSRMPSSA